MGRGHGGRDTRFEGSNHMWRLLLARAHPDAGGAHDLFLFACALRDSYLAQGSPAEPSPGEASAESSSPPPSWRSSMNSWASRNREALRRSRPWRASTRAG